jgi:hypothetical protein
VSLVSAEDIALVKSAEDMSDSNFELHMNMRHPGESGGLGSIDLSHVSPYVVHCWRMFHRTIHRLRQAGMNHEHAQYQGDNDEQPQDRAKAG